MTGHSIHTQLLDRWGADEIPYVAVVMIEEAVLAAGMSDEPDVILGVAARTMARAHPELLGGRESTATDEADWLRILKDLRP